MRSMNSGGDFDIGAGPMQPVDYSKVEGQYIEVSDKADNTIAAGFIPSDLPNYIPNDPRD